MARSRTILLVRVLIPVWPLMRIVLSLPPGDRASLRLIKRPGDLPIRMLFDRYCSEYQMRRSGWLYYHHCRSDSTIQVNAWFQVNSITPHFHSAKASAACVGFCSLWHAGSLRAHQSSILVRLPGLDLAQLVGTILTCQTLEGGGFCQCRSLSYT